jgi:hypothetical protein
VFYNSTNPTAAMLLFIAFEFVVNVLLLNVLIASMTNSFAKITQVGELALFRSNINCQRLFETLDMLSSQRGVSHMVSKITLHGCQIHAVPCASFTTSPMLGCQLP